MEEKGWMKVSVGTYCSKCKGECWDKKDNNQTIRNAREKFGVVPNRCVNGSRGFAEVHCPYAQNSK